MTTTAATLDLHPLLRGWGLSLPLLQAPMAGVATPALAAAVSEAGGLGALGLGAGDATAGEAAIRATRALTGRAFNVNLFCHRPPRRDPAREAAWLQRLRPLFAALDAEPPAALAEIYRPFDADPDMLAMLVAERPAVVSFHFGLPAPASVAALRAAGCSLLATVTSVAEARAAAAAGMDALVAQGVEAGGHRGVFEPGGDDLLALMPLLAQLGVEPGLPPVIAAGGLMRGADIARALHAGACAAQLGTAFVACPESAAGPAYRAALAGAGARHTRLITAISGRSARGVPDAFVAALGTVPEGAVPDYPLAYDAAKALERAARRHGDTGYGAFWAGQGVPLARAMPAAQLCACLAAELEAARAADANP